MNRKSDFHRRLESYLPPLIEFLMRVSRLSPSQQEAEDDEGIRSRQWHSLREPFAKFVKEAGY